MADQLTRDDGAWGGRLMGCSHRRTMGSSRGRSTSYPEGRSTGRSGGRSAGYLASDVRRATTGYSHVARTLDGFLAGTILSLLAQTLDRQTPCLNVRRLRATSYRWVNLRSWQSSWWIILVGTALFWTTASLPHNVRETVTFTSLKSCS